MKKYHIITYGCQTNHSDSERISSVLEDMGYSFVEDKYNADLVVINSCSIRQSAVNRIYGQIENIKNGKVIVTGCILKRDGKKLSKKADLILDTKDLLAWPEIIDGLNKKDLDNYFKIKPKNQGGLTALIPIMTGCNNFCSYCVVPYTRGRELSRPLDDIIEEVRLANEKGNKEVWLLGQNVNSYKGKDSKGKEVNFCQLIKEVEKVPGNFWIRFTSSHPKDFSDELIEIIKGSEKITKYLHLPVQSGDDEILERMNRPYKISDYKKFVQKIKKELPDLTLSTDVIVGFPKETEEQFQKTADLFREIPYDMAYISKYSPRPGTPSFKLKDDISNVEKERRWTIINEILMKNNQQRNKFLINKTVEALIEKEKDGFIIGKTKEYKSIKVKGPRSLVGNFVKIKVNKSLSWGLEGDLTN
ncbi:MAG: tRNA (N6-isopentenyl adenosine(37)-C2)-methylthiotransferase MiaB [Candidatus Nealsonbacteria bacterium]|nr:tRNA (N6-isopentenyl adenosine(37)-C2)-methylthiotransferase MiaB [Candidatus Nealsonbacteria bacterium]